MMSNPSPFFKNSQWEALWELSTFIEESSQKKVKMLSTFDREITEWENYA